MKDDRIAWDLNEMPGGESRPVAISNLKRANSDFSPPCNDIGKLAYFNYVNRGSEPGGDVEDWLAAEAQLVGEHDSWGSRGLCGEV
jgi:hypothetical protein